MSVLAVEVDRLPNRGLQSQAIIIYIIIKNNRGVYILYYHPEQQRGSDPPKLSFSPINCLQFYPNNKELGKQ